MPKKERYCRRVQGAAELGVSVLWRGEAPKKKKKKKKDSGSDSDSDSNSSDSDGAVIACRQCSHGRKCRLQGSPGHLRGY
mmetsp:Transcript_8727/g.17763  ORF Transcript_8727/g.17763 Transcript_8727/m.17763 type:complete len:80 (-) Transcript_8727:96-335(-)